MTAKILLIEDDRIFQELTGTCLESSGYSVDIAADGEEGIRRATERRYDAVIVDLMMPRIHGFEVIQELRARSETRRTPLLVYSAKIYESDQRQALDLGANGFLQKPLQPDMVREALDDLLHSVRVTFWGVRGSVAAPGPETVRYGGNTPCVTLEYQGRTLILDAGTGIRKLGLILQAEARSQPIDVDLLVTHTHWDHIQGFPFFVPAYVPGNRINVYGPRSLSKPLDKVLRGQMDPEYFPVALGDMAADIRVHDVRTDVIDVGPFSIRHAFMNHPGVTLGYRIEAGGMVVTYATDTEPFTRLLSHTMPDDAAAAGYGRNLDTQLLELVRDADLYIGDGQYTHTEYCGKVGWGHSSCEDATLLAAEAGARRFAVYSHDPMQDDDAVDAKVARCRALANERSPDLEVFGAREGQTVVLRQGRARVRV